MTMEKGQLILVNDFLNTINAGLKDKMNYTYRWGGWNNGGSIPYGQRSHSGYANLKSEVAQNITDKEVKALVIDGQLIKPDYTAKFCTKLYEAWKKIAEEHHVDITYTSCHRNCHDNCHGSGGWR